MEKNEVGMKIVGVADKFEIRFNLTPFPGGIKH